MSATGPAASLPVGAAVPPSLPGAGVIVAASVRLGSLRLGPVGTSLGRGGASGSRSPPVAAGAISGAGWGMATGFLHFGQAPFLPARLRSLTTSALLQCGQLNLMGMAPLAIL